LALLVAPAASVRAADLLALHVATIPTDAGSDVYYAKEQGFFLAAGLNVEIDSVASGAAIISAISGGSYDIGAANPLAIAAARGKGIPIKIVAPGAVHVDANPTDLLMVAQRSTLRSARDLIGKTVAVVSLGGLNPLGLQAWIARGGGELSSVRLVEVPIPAMAAALEAGRVDAAQMAEPFITANKNLIRPLADPYTSIGDRFLIDAWIASDSWLAQHADAAKRFAVALRNAHEWANAHHKESAAILVRYIKLPPDVADTMARARFGSALDPAQLQPLLDAAAKFGQLEHPLPATDLIWSAP